MLLRGASGSFQDAPTPNDTALQLAYQKYDSTTNAFNFFGRLQDFDEFIVTYEVWCSGVADAIYFYFGGVNVPCNEDDTCNASMAFLVANDIYNGDVGNRLGSGLFASMRADSLKVMVEDIDFNSNTASWIKMRVQYIRDSSSFAVYVSAEDSILLTVHVPDAITWFSNLSGSNWGIAARTGALAGDFLFRKLQVVASLEVCNICSPGTYSTNAGEKQILHP